MAEDAFARNFLSTVSSQPIIYADQYQQPPSNSLKRVPILPINIPAPPEPSPASSSSSSASVSLTFKSTKPPLSFTLTVAPSDSVSSIKSQVASQPGAPPAIVQRLLLKGKALADGKLLQEYTVKDGDTINLMVKPGSTWDPTASPNELATAPASDPLALSPSLSPLPSPAGGKKHTRIPSVVLSPSPSSENLLSGKPTADIELDGEEMAPSVAPERMTTYHATVSKPEFWQGMLGHLKSQFPEERDAVQAFEDFLRASKSTLSASEIAKIRDIAGVTGMSGI